MKRMLVIVLLVGACAGSTAVPAAPTAATLPTAAALAPTPTSVPTPVVTPEPTSAPKPEPPILKASGRGDKIVKFSAQDAPTVVRITGKGSGHFAVISYTGSEYGDLLVNQAGKYSGSVYVEPGVNRFKVTSSGSWTIQVQPITSAKHWDGTSSFAGKGDSVVSLTGWASGITTIRNKSKSNFAVIAHTEEGDYLDLLVNDVGSYSGEVLLPEADPMILVIHAVGGTWSLSAVEQ